MLRLDSDRKQTLDQIADRLKLSKNAVLELALDGIAQKLRTQLTQSSLGDNHYLGDETICQRCTENKQG
ncbi:hypothetical protein C7B70_24785 [Chlorogloea sp. CCALA 695]|nr:hypothetical protein C7B70_24785 [Chlorogloea sp. CCALA 695]